MKQAGNAEFIIWVIVAVIVMVGKGLGKLAAPAAEGEPKKVEPKPVPHPRTSPRPPLTSQRTVRRGVPPVVRPLTVAAVPPVIPLAPVVPEEKPKPAAAVVPPAPPSRSNQWASALRDRQNIRNVIIANEIIGRPVSVREPV